jgi:hypothetical protein
MGMSWHTLKLLCEARSRGLNMRDTVTIGRQRTSVPTSEILQMLHRYGIKPPVSLSELPDSLVYADPVFSWLGAQRVEFIDYSDYEGATLVCDMNSPIPEAWHEQFDVVLDGGSIEHVFNVPQVFANYMNLVRVGGTVMVVTPANNSVGHGFYQFSPELFYRVFSANNGFQVDRLALYEAYAHSPIYDAPDPASLHSRLELSNSWIGVYLMVQARRIRKTRLFESWPQQSDYTELWAGERDDPCFVTAINEVPRNLAMAGGIRAELKKLFPFLRRWKQGLEQMFFNRFPSLAERRERKWSRNWAIASRKQFGFTARPEWFRPTQ